MKKNPITNILRRRTIKKMHLTPITSFPNKDLLVQVRRFYIKIVSCVDFLRKKETFLILIMKGTYLSYEIKLCFFLLYILSKILRKCFLDELILRIFSKT